MSANKIEIVAEEGKNDFSIIREFEAPIEKVFKAFTDPVYLKQWYMPEEMAFTIETMHCQTGGYYKNHHTHANGMRFGFHGVYHEVDAPTLIIRTSEFSGLPQKLAPTLETTRFETTDKGNTKVIIHTLCISHSFRDAMIENGLRNHMQISYGLLDHLLTTV